MANPFYTNTFTGAAGQIARAEAVDAQFGGIQSGFEGVNTELGATLQGQPGETMNLLPPAAQRAGKTLLFDSNGQPIAQFSSLNWRGMWTPNTAYDVGDLVQSGVHQSIWYCTTQHTSGTTFSSADWSTFIDLTGLQWASYSIINTAGTYNLNIGDSVGVDTTAGSVTLNLPTGMSVGASPVNVTNIGGSLTGSQLLTVSAGTNFIMGNTNNTLAVDVVNASMSFYWMGAPYGWRLRTLG